MATPGGPQIAHPFNMSSWPLEKDTPSGKWKTMGTEWQVAFLSSLLVMSFEQKIEFSRDFQTGKDKK